MLMQPPRPNPASYAGALLYEAEANPGTPAAEEALIWIVKQPRSMARWPSGPRRMIARATMFGARRSSRYSIRPQRNRHGWIESHRTNVPRSAGQKPSTARSGHWLATIWLDTSMTRPRPCGSKALIDPAQRENCESPLKEAGWGQDYDDRLTKVGSRGPGTRGGGVVRASDQGVRRPATSSPASITSLAIFLLP